MRILEDEAHDGLPRALLCAGAGALHSHDEAGGTGVGSLDNVLRALLHTRLRAVVHDRERRQRIIMATQQRGVVALQAPREASHQRNARRRER